MYLLLLNVCIIHAIPIILPLHLFGPFFFDLSVSAVLNSQIYETIDHIHPRVHLCLIYVVH